MRKASVVYDPDEDLLYIYSSERPLYSIDVGDLVLDINKRGIVTGVEVFNASKFFGLGKKILDQVRSARISSNVRDMWLIVNIALVIRRKEERAAIRVPLAREIREAVVEA